MTRTLALIVVAAVLAGCSSLEAPRAEVVAVNAGEVTDQGGVVAFTVLLNNPNDVALPVTKVSYTVTLGDDDFTFDATPPVTMPVYSQQTFTLPAAFATPAVVGKPVRVVGRAYYQPPGKIREALTDMNIPLPHASFEATATLE